MKIKKVISGGILQTKSFSILTFAFLLIAFYSLNAQTVIGGLTPDPSAMLDVQGNQKGVLFPRMTTADRDLIQNAAMGLMIFNTTTECLEINLSSGAPASWSSIICLGRISGINCTGATLSGNLFSGQSASSVSVSIPYTGGNGGAYSGQTVSSTGVTGLIATLAAGNFGSGAYNLTYTISGTPSAAGTAAFLLNIGGQSCTLNLTVQQPFTLNCGAAIRKGEMQPNFAASGVSIIVPYSGGTGGAHSGQIVSSTEVTGYTATLAAGNFASGTGTLTYTIEGTATTTGTAKFALSIGGSSCDLDLNVRSCGAFVAAGDWRIFGCYNLGAFNTRADAFMPGWEINGGYWQWGRSAQAASGPIGPDLSQANSSGAIAGWITTNASNGSWVDTSPMGNNPCPAGFRLPTLAQWTGVRDANLNIPSNVGGTWTEGATNYTTGRKYGDELFLPAAGSRYASGVFDRGTNGYYWSSTENPSNATQAWYLNFGVSNNNVSIGAQRSTGFTLRCIAGQ